MPRPVTCFALLIVACLLALAPCAPTPTAAQTNLLQVAYITDAGGVPGLAVMNADGTGQRRLVDVAPDETPVWSPDGTQIAYIRLTDTGARELAVIDVAAQSARNLTTLGGIISHPTWSPSGDRIAFSAAMGGPADVYTIQPDGSSPVNVTAHSADDRAPSWSPDGSRLVFQSNRDSAAGGPADIYTANRDGTDLLRLTTDPGADVAPLWSPDGMRIVFISSRDGNANIFVIDFNGTNLVRLSDTPLDDSAPTWSPDGVYVAFVGATAPEVTELFVINADGIHLSQLTVDGAQVETPAWSPAGDQIAFASNRGGTFNLYTLAPDGTSWTALTNDLTANLIRPAWSSVAPAAGLPTLTPTSTPTSPPPTITPMVTSSEPLVLAPTLTPTPSALPPTLPPTPTLFRQTPVPTLTLAAPAAASAAAATPVPTLTAIDLTLVYDPALPSFFLVNTSGRRLNIANVSFSGNGRDVRSSVWLTSGSLSTSLFDFPAGGCLGLWGLDVPTQAAPGLCSQRHGWWSSDTVVFWTGGQFTVFNNGTPIATCASDARTCSVDLEGPPVAAAPTGSNGSNTTLTNAAAAAQTADLRLTYDAALPALFLTNTSSRAIDLSPLLFEGNNRRVTSDIWTPVMTGSIYALPAGDCLGVWGYGVQRQPAPAGCDTRQGWLESDQYLFWTSNSFTVSYDGTLLATCTAAAGQCDLALP